MLLGFPWQAYEPCWHIFQLILMLLFSFVNIHTFHQPSILPTFKNMFSELPVPDLSLPELQYALYGFFILVKSVTLWVIPES